MRQLVFAMLLGPLLVTASADRALAQTIVGGHCYKHNCDFRGSDCPQCLAEAQSGGGGGGGMGRNPIERAALQGAHDLGAAIGNAIVDSLFNDHSDHSTQNQPSAEEIARQRAAYEAAERARRAEEERLRREAEERERRRLVGVAAAMRQAMDARDADLQSSLGDVFVDRSTNFFGSGGGGRIVDLGDGDPNDSDPNVVDLRDKIEGQTPAVDWERLIEGRSRADAAPISPIAPDHSQEQVLTGAGVTQGTPDKAPPPTPTSVMESGVLRGAPPARAVDMGPRLDARSTRLMLDLAQSMADSLQAGTGAGRATVDLLAGRLTPFDPGARRLPVTTWNDPMVVDLRDLGSATALVQQAGAAGPGDATKLWAQAERAASGDVKFTPGATPAVSEQGLLAFQRANADYREANDGRFHLREVFADAERRREAAAKVVTAAQWDLERAKQAMASAATLEEKERLLARALADLKAEDEALRAAKERLDAAGLREKEARDERLRVIRWTAATQPPAGADPTAWTRAQQGMFLERAALERDASRVLREIDALGVPPPTGWTHVSEGVILGLWTNKESANKVTYSPYTGKKLAELNEPGKGGAVVVSFGTPDQSGVLGKGEDLLRVIRDHVSDGKFSPTTPQAREALDQLAGKEYDRLTAHSNGAMIAEALLRDGTIKAKELDVVGGDRSLLNERALQDLIDTGKVQRVVVWANVNDPVPFGTSLCSLPKAPAQTLEHVARQMTDNLGQGGNVVEYRFMVGPTEGTTPVIGPHFLTEGYFPGITKAFGVTPPN